MKNRRIYLAGPYGIVCFFALACLARADDVTEQYRFTAFPYYHLTTNWTLFAQLGYQINPDQRTQTYDMLSPGVYYKFNSWFQLWGGLNNRYNQVNGGANTFLLRPFFGPKLDLPNKWECNLYNFTQFEYRATKNLDTEHWSTDPRIRSRFEADVPLTRLENAWKSRTWYSVTSVEPFYDINDGEVVQLRVAGGVGYVLNKYSQLELVYYAQFARSDGGPLEYNENIFRLNLKIGFNRKNDAKEAAAINSQ